MLAGVGLLLPPVVARAADQKAKSATKSGKKKSGDGLSDDKAISKQLQWEDSVMGPDDKRAELDKIARAQAINKAAAEKAERDKEKAAVAAARESAAPKPQTTKRGGDVALPSLSDDEPSAGHKGRSADVSPKLESAEAAAPPPPIKHGDDKFIDKLLKEEPAAKKKKAASASDQELADLLSTESKPKPAAKSRGKRADDVDSLLETADKAPAMPEVKVRHETPEWAKPEIASTPVAAPVIVRPQPKRDDGIIHVVQGAAEPAARSAPARQSTPTRSAFVPASRRQSAAAAPAARSGGWNDPFADAPRKNASARDNRSSATMANDLPMPRRSSGYGSSAAATRREPVRTAHAETWNDPFADSSRKAPASRRAPAPAARPAARGNEAPARWKDPFTDQSSSSSGSSRGAFAMRDRRAAAASNDSGDSPRGESHGGWGILKKSAH